MDAVVAQFNDADDASQILMTSLRTTSASVNLQEAYHHMIFLDVPGSANTLMQAVGRIFCLSQTHAQMVWIVITDYMYD